jgi:hypothetical protein
VSSQRRKKYITRGVPPKRSRTRIAPRKKDPAKRRWAKHRDPRYTAWIKLLGCLVCGRRPVDPAHLIPQALGSDDRDNLIPLCRQHHNEQEGRTAEFEERYNFGDLRTTARLLTTAYLVDEVLLPEFPAFRGLADQDGGAT